MSEDNRVLRRPDVPLVGVGGDCDHRFPRYGRSERPSLQEEDGFKRLLTSEDNGTFVYLPCYPLGWVRTEDIGLPGVGDLEG